MGTHSQVQVKSKAEEEEKKPTITMLSINGCLLLLLASMASLGSAQPKSPNEPLLQPRLGCGFPEILSCSGDILDAVKTCLNTGSAEEVLDCVKNILDSIGQGDCGACICDVFPKICQEKEEMKKSLRISDIKEKDTEAEIRSDEGEEECYYCSPYVHSAFQTCWNTAGPHETMVECIEKLMDSNGWGPCKHCIRDFIPAEFC